MYCKPTLASSFTPLQTYKVLKPTWTEQTQNTCFTPLQTYKVLKLIIGEFIWECRFTPLQTYKVLKQTVKLLNHRIVLHHYKLTRFSNFLNAVETISAVLHHYKLTRFSNGGWVTCVSVMFYTITNLQGSQTASKVHIPFGWFYTITNLQGSQTQNGFTDRTTQFYTITNLQGSQTNKDHALLAI